MLLQMVNKCVFLRTGKAGDDKHQRSDNETIAMQLEDAQELFLWKDEQGSTLTVQSNLLKVGAYKRNNGTIGGHFQWVSENDRYPTHEDLHQQWTQHCDYESRNAAWKLHKSIDKILGTRR